MAAAVSEWLDEALLLVPETVEMESGRFAPYPLSSSSAVSGRTYRLKGIGRWIQGVELVVGDEGISLVVGDNVTITVRFVECEAVLRSPSGRHVLCGSDGIELWFDPADFRGGDAIVRALERAVPKERYIPVSDEEIPPP